MNIAEGRGSRGHCIAYDVEAAAKARGASPRKYAEGDPRRAGVNPCRGNSAPARLWVSKLDPAHSAANSAAMAAGKPAPYTYAKGTYRLDASDKRPRSVRRQSYKPLEVAL